jgi:hypothetical protein
MLSLNHTEGRRSYFARGGNLIFPPIVSPTALLIAMVLAVFKPWGRIRKGSAIQRDAR